MMAVLIAVGYAVLFLILNGKLSGKAYYRTFLIIAFALSVLLGCVCLFVFADDAYVDAAKAVFFGTSMGILYVIDENRRWKKRKKNK